MAIKKDMLDGLLAGRDPLESGRRVLHRMLTALQDAPEPFIVTQISRIVGIEIVIARIEGKWKVSQNRSSADRQGVAEGLRSEGSNGSAVARLVGERGGSGSD